MMRMIRGAGICAAVMSALATFASPAWAPIVDHGAWSLALGPQGHPSVSYVYGFLCLASRGESGAWSHEVVDYGGYARSSAGTSLAIDAAGDPFIAFSDGAGRLALARRTMSGWNVEGVDPDVRAAYPSLALDGLGRPRVAYVDETNGLLKFCAWSGTEWSIETIAAIVDPEFYVPVGGSLALESDGDPCVSFFDYMDSHLKLASRHSGVWAVEVVQGPLEVTWSSLALESDDDPCVGFRDATGDFKLASRHGGTWEVETVEHVGSAAVGGSLALDSSGQPCASYGEGDDWELRFAEKQDGTWSMTTVDAGFKGTGIGSVLELDAQDVPHVAYNVSRDVGGLEYATRLGAVWQTELVVSWPTGVGEPPSRRLGLTAWPNPIRGGPLRVAFSTPEGTEASAELSLYDVTGRRVARLYHGPVSAHPREVLWDGRDEHERPVPGGVYLLKARDDRGGESRMRIVVLR